MPSQLANFAKKPFAPYILLTALAALMAILLQSFEGQNLPTQSASPDTYIPAGFVLVPIEIQNLHALDSIIGKSGTVDLFRPSVTAGKKPTLVKRRARILRAPKNPNQFAALVKENEVYQLLASDQPLFAVVQNPTNQNPVKVVEKKLKKRSRIIKSLIDPSEGD